MSSKPEPNAVPENMSPREYHLRRAIYHLAEADERTNGITSPTSSAKLTSAKNDAKNVLEALDDE